MLCLAACDDPPPPKPVDLNDAKALSEKYEIAATVHCGADADDYLRSVSRFAFKWDELGTFDAKFDRFMRQVDAPGVLTETSNKVALQNGFGAYVRIQLYCDYDTQHEKVLGYSVNERNLHPIP